MVLTKCAKPFSVTVVPDERRPKVRVFGHLSHHLQIVWEGNNSTLWHLYTPIVLKPYSGAVILKTVPVHHFQPGIVIMQLSVGFLPSRIIPVDRPAKHDFSCCDILGIEVI